MAIKKQKLFVYLLHKLTLFKLIKIDLKKVLEVLIVIKICMLSVSKLPVSSIY